jgi:hypothetical protein
MKKLENTIFAITGIGGRVLRLMTFLSNENFSVLSKGFADFSAPFARD